MTLIKCPNCGQDISDKAEKCPHCGWEKKREKKNKEIVEWCEFWLFALIVAGIIEITFGVFFYVFLALIICAENDKEKRR